jgi:hypothetical protein
MVGQFVLGVGLAAVVALGRADDRGDGRRDAGLRDLRAVCDQSGSSGRTIDIARAVLRREEGKLPAAPK